MADNARVTQSQVEVLVTANANEKVWVTQAQTEVIVTENANEKVWVTQVQIEVIEILPVTGAAALDGIATLLAAGGFSIEGQVSVICAAAFAGIGSGYVTTDSFTEAGDTALTSHTDDEGNSWSLTGFDTVQISGANDNVEVK